MFYQLAQKPLFSQSNHKHQNTRHTGVLYASEPNASLQSQANVVSRIDRYMEIMFVDLSHFLASTEIWTTGRFLFNIMCLLSMAEISSVLLSSLCISSYLKQFGSILVPETIMHEPRNSPLPLSSRVSLDPFVDNPHFDPDTFVPMV